MDPALHRVSERQLPIQYRSARFALAGTEHDGFPRSPANPRRIRVLPGDQHHAGAVGGDEFFLRQWSRLGQRDHQHLESTDPTTYYQIGSQLFLLNAYLEFTIPAIGPLRPRIMAGYFGPFYGSLSEYGLGMYTNPLVGSPRGVGELFAIAQFYRDEVVAWRDLGARFQERRLDFGRGISRPTLERSGPIGLPLPATMWQLVLARRRRRSARRSRHRPAGDCRRPGVHGANECGEEVELGIGEGERRHAVVRDSFADDVSDLRGGSRAESAAVG